MWDKIGGFGQLVTPPKNYSPLFLFKTSSSDGTGWLVGRYCELKKFATNLRNDKELREFLTNNQVRLGVRDDDVPPKDVKPQREFGPLVQGENHRQVFTAARPNPRAQPVYAKLARPDNRRNDREENVKQFWETQTPQSHHIVEFNNLETLGKSHERGCTEMDYQKLPAVLLAAEFHQAYISKILKPTHRLEKKDLQLEIVSIYKKLYTDRSTLFEPLWKISKIILREAGLECS